MSEWRKARKRSEQVQWRLPKHEFTLRNAGTAAETVNEKVAMLGRDIIIKDGNGLHIVSELEFKKLYEVIED